MHDGIVNMMSDPAGQWIVSIILSIPLMAVILLTFKILWALPPRVRRTLLILVLVVLFFPLIFLSATFVPKQYITSSWLKVAADINPTTYVFNAMRSVLIDGWRAGPLLVGLAVVLAFATVTGALALWQARRATQLK